jgi:membrane fusion protein (multidrug efflux system)
MSEESDMRKSFLWCTVLMLIMGTEDYAISADTTSALVQTQPLVQHVIVETISSYGIVSFDPLNTESINFPRAGQVARLLVAQGEVVKKDTPLLQMETSPQESVSYEQARSAVGLAKGELARVQNLLGQQLATRSQVANAQKALQDAEASLAAQEKLGTGVPSEIILAPFDGIVSAVQIAQGDRIQPGAPAMQLSRIDRPRIVLGIEPEDAPKVKRGMPVKLIPVFDSTRSAAGLLSTINGMINPQTGLVDILVSLKPGQSLRLMPGTRIRGLIILNSRRETAVPRQAVLSDAHGSYVFVVRNGRAHRIDVQTNGESDGLIGISGYFEKQDRVVVVGNYELQEGMEVREPSP